MNAKYDENNRPTITASSSNDGSTIIPLVAVSGSHRLMINDGTTGTDNGNNNDVAMLDENGVAVATALASDGSGRIIECYADPLTKRLLINQN